MPARRRRRRRRRSSVCCKNTSKTEGRYSLDSPWVYILLLCIIDRYQCFPLPYLTLPLLPSIIHFNQTTQQNITQHNTTYLNATRSCTPPSFPPFSLISLEIALMTHHIRSLWSLFYFPLSLFLPLPFLSPFLH